MHSVLQGGSIFGAKTGTFCSGTWTLFQGGRGGQDLALAER